MTMAILRTDVVVLQQSAVLEELLKSLNWRMNKQLVMRGFLWGIHLLLLRMIVLV